MIYAPLASVQHTKQHGMSSADFQTEHFPNASQVRCHVQTCQSNILKQSMAYISFFLLAQQSPVGQGLLIHEVSRSHKTTDHSR